MILQITIDFWDKLNSLYLFLEPFKYSINQIQKDNASLYSVWCNFHKIMEFYGSAEIPKIFNEEKENIIELFKSKWNDHNNNDLIEAV
jgi:hypothetical protein